MGLGRDSQTERPPLHNTAIRHRCCSIAVLFSYVRRQNRTKTHRFVNASTLSSCTCPLISPAILPYTPTPTKKTQEEDSAFGTYAGAGGKRLVYRERTAGGNYRIIEQNVDEAMSREQMLDMRATKKADRHCN